MSSDNLPPGYTGSDDFGCGSDFRFGRSYGRPIDDDEYAADFFARQDEIAADEHKNDWGE